MKRSKLALLLPLAFLACACAESYAPVTMPFTAKSVADFAAYRDLFFIDFVCDVPDADIRAAGEVRRFFTEEVPFAVGRKVVRLEPEHWDTVLDVLQRYRLSAEVQFEDSVFFRKVFQAHPQALFFTGRLKLVIKKMGVVKEKRDETGERRNVYETMDLWELEMKVSLIDGDSASVILQETYTEKAEPGPASTPRFQFNSMFARMGAKLTAALQPRKVLQERFILSK